MTTLAKALQATSWRQLKIIGRQRGLRFSSNIRKKALIEDLKTVLADPANLAQALEALPTPARRLLVDVLTAGGRLARHHLLSGEIEAAQALEELLARGLLFEAASDGSFFFPTDLLTLLPEPSLPPPAAPPPLPDGRPAPVDLLCHDLAVFLALLQREDIVPLHQRWLPPRFLAEWGQTCRVAPLCSAPGSELQTGRRRFLHYLAENSGLVPALFETAAGSGRAPNPLAPAPIAYLKPSPAAWLWLHADRTEQLQTVWAAWLQPDPERWRKYRLPGCDWLTDPAALIGPLQQGLVEIDVADPQTFARTFLKRYPEQRDLVPANRLRPRSLLIGTIIDVLAGPLRWLGLLQKKADAAGGYALTAQGQAWLMGRPLPAGQSFQPVRFSLGADIRPNLFDSRLTLSARHGLPRPADVAAAVEISVSGDGPAGQDARINGDADAAAGRVDLFATYQVTAASLVRAIHHGWRPPALLAAVNGLVDRPLTPAETALLQRWAAAADKMILRLACLLETREPGVIRRLAASRRGRAFIEQTLSPGAVKVDPARVPALVWRLTQQEGIPPLVVDRARFAARPQPQTALSEADAAHMWLALHVYQALSQHITLPARTPQALLDHLAAVAGPVQLSAAEVAAEQTLAALKRVIDGFVSFPPWREPALPVEETVALLEKAVAGGRLLQMSYYTAGRDELTHRRVEPYRLEWRGKTPYLVAFCHRAWQERLFRVDRIQALTIVNDE